MGQHGAKRRPGLGPMSSAVLPANGGGANARHADRMCIATSVVEREAVQTADLLWGRARVPEPQAHGNLP